jgi:N-acetylneuraminate synthase
MEQFDPACYKIPSASLTDDKLLQYTAAKGRVLVVSTGMSTMEEIRHAVSLLDQDRIVICHATSTYPCPPAELNLRMITTLRKEFDCRSGTQARVVVDAYACQLSLSRRAYITVDRQCGEPTRRHALGFMRLVRDIRSPKRRWATD